jgi:hypothetical protein
LPPPNSIQPLLPSNFICGSQTLLKAASYHPSLYPPPPLAFKLFLRLHAISEQKALFLPSPTRNPTTNLTLRFSTPAPKSASFENFAKSQSTLSPLSPCTKAIILTTTPPTANRPFPLLHEPRLNALCTHYEYSGLLPPRCNKFVKSRTPALSPTSLFVPGAAKSATLYLSPPKSSLTLTPSFLIDLTTFKNILSIDLIKITATNFIHQLIIITFF